MAITQILDHAARALGRLAMQLKESATHQGKLNAWSQQIQELEDAAYALLGLRSIDDCEGVQLDGIGVIVGAPRGNLDDAGYRLRIKAQILINRRSGEVETLIAILKQLLPLARIKATELPPACIELEVQEVILTQSDADLCATLLRSGKVGGVSLQLWYQAADLDATFTLSSDNTYETSDTLGLGDSTDPTIGGSLQGAA
jgi:hypothetical protein